MPTPRPSTACTASRPSPRCRRRVSDVIDIEIVALCGWPVVGPAGADQRSLLVDALAAGADLVGGCPHLEDSGDTRGATEFFLQTATDHGVGVDLHTDETLDPDVLGLVDLAEMVLAGFDAPRDGQPLREPRHAGRPTPSARSPNSSRPPASASSRSPTPTCSSRAAATPRCHADSPPSPRSARAGVERRGRRRQPPGSVQPGRARLPVRDRRTDDHDQPSPPRRGLGIGHRQRRDATGAGSSRARRVHPPISSPCGHRRCERRSRSVRPTATSGVAG